MMIWDGAVYVSSGVITGSNSVDTQVDGAMFGFNSWGHFFCDSSKYMPIADYADPIGAGNVTGGGNSAGPGSVTKANQAAENKDAYNYGWLPYSLRFRHNNNTKANVLFADGHVESRGLTEIKAIDVCVSSF
jgi:prepilin-type processing-associated H-X9-DG protein